MSMEATTDDRTNPLTDLTAFQQDMLLAAEDVEENGSTREERLVSDFDDPSGQCIKQRLEEYGHDGLTHGRLYPNLDTLVNKGLLERNNIDRRTKSYTLTTRGQRELDEFKAFVGGGN
jgi:hypothetical protein